MSTDDVNVYFTRSELTLSIFLRLSPLPSQLILQLDTFSTGEKGHGKRCL